MLEGAIRQPSSAASRPDLAPVILAHEQPFHIGSAEFRPATREVLLDGRTSIIEPRVMQVLVAMRRANGGVVGKDDLAILCWEGRIVGEDAINRVISRLRGVADKQAGKQFRVETITKVGYRLVPTDNSAETASAVEESHLRSTRRELVIGGSAVALVGAMGLGWTILQQREQLPKEARLLVDNARKSLRQGDFDTSGNAVGTLRHAAEIAPRSAEVWGLLAYAYAVQAVDAAVADRRDLHARAVAATNRAFAIEPHQADALAAQLCTLPLYRNWFFYEQACRAALRHHPNHPELLLQLGNLLAEVGRCREALKLTDRILPSMPLSADVLTGRAFLMLNLGELEEADSAIENAFSLLPRNYNVWTSKAFYLLFNGRPREAAAMFSDKDGRPAAFEDYDLCIMQANAVASGDPVEIRNALDRLLRVAETGKGFIVATTLFAAFTGNVDQAFRLLNALYFNRGWKIPSIYFDRAYTNGGRHTGYLFDRPMTALRRDSRFGAMTRELGLDDYWARTNSSALVVR